jgi:hypothetical protein
LTVLGLAAGDWAGWVGGVGTVLAFGATSLAIWQGHRLRRAEHADEMYDEALKVTATVGMGSDYVEHTNADGTKERTAVPKVLVTVHNSGRRQITNVAVDVTTPSGHPVGASSAEFLQAAWDQPFYFDAVDGVWGQLGSSPAINALATLSFEDIEETKWVRESNGRLLRFRRLRRRHRGGRRHSTSPRLTP